MKSLQTQNVRNLRRNYGFTLTELVIVIVLIGIISAVIVPLIGNKFSAVNQSTERASWVQQAEYAMFHIQQDLAVSVPNSIYVSELDQVIEFLGIDSQSSVYAARYRDKQLLGFDRLQPNNDSSFDVFGNFPNLATTANFVSIGTSDSSLMRTDWQTNMGSNSGTLARIDSAINTTGGSEDGGPLTTVTLTANHNFGGHSPYYRAYFFSGPVGYECDTVDGFLYRVSSYTDLSLLSFSNRTDTAQKDRVIDNVRSCSFELTDGSVYSPPTLRVTLGIGSATENITLISTLLLSNGS
jgi:MSHA biogenesis protein MshO